MKSDQTNSSEIMIREFRIEDYDVVITLWDDVGLPYRPEGRDSRQRIENEIRQETSIFLIAEMNTKLVGTVLGTHDGRKGWINRLAVDHEFRRHNIARRLVTEVEDRLSRLGIDIIACLIEGWNVESMQVFQRLGYEKYPEIVYFSKRRSPEA